MSGQSPNVEIGKGLVARRHSHRGDNNIWWKSERIARTFPYASKRNLQYWAEQGYINFESLGKTRTHRYYSPEEVERIGIMCYLITKCGFGIKNAGKVATLAIKADVQDNRIWVRYNKLTIGIPIEEIYSEAFSN